jgi:Ni/Co efflux regulator RcnB
MKSKAIVSLVVVSMLGMSATVFAQQHEPYHSGGGHRPPPHEASVARPGGPIPHSDWHKGERLPAEYRDRNYVVDNWHEHGLSAPPRGYQWVGVNGDYVLVAISTGLIASVLLSGQ